MKRSTRRSGRTGARKRRQLRRGKGSLGAKPEELRERAAEAASYPRIDDDLERAPERIKPVLRLIRANLFRPGFNVAQVRRSLTLRSHDATTEFRRHTGTPIRRYIEDRRLECASRLLLDTGLDLHEIADLVGYVRWRTFSNAFSRQQGCRPRVYRDSGGGLGRLSVTSPATTGVPPFVAGLAAVAPGTCCARCGSALDAAPTMRIFEQLEPLCDPCARRHAPPELVTAAVAGRRRPQLRGRGPVSRSLRGLFSSVRGR